MRVSVCPERIGEPDRPIARHVALCAHEPDRPDDDARPSLLAKLIAQGNVVLTISEGALGGRHTAFYDLFRVQDGKVQCELRVDVAFDHGIPASGTWLVFATLADAGNRTERVLRRVAQEIFEIEL